MATFYVDATAPAGGNGLSWTNAFSSLTVALQAAQPNDFVRIAQGTYRPTGAGRAATFTLPPDVLVLGSFAGRNAPNPDAQSTTSTPTILSGDIGTLGDASDNAYHVVTVPAYPTQRVGAFLTNVTITQGNADGTGGTDTSYGAGVFNLNSNFTASQVSFVSNTTSGSGRNGGAGIYSRNAGSVFVLNSTFTGNRASLDANGFGGAVLSDGTSTTNLTNPTMTFNAAGYGGAVATSGGAGLRFDAGGTVQNNTAQLGGGALALFGGTATILQANIRVNTAGQTGVQAGLGGGIYVDGATLTTNRTFVRENSARGPGANAGAVYVRNGGSYIALASPIVGNNSEGDTGGIYVDPTSTITSTGSVIVTNISASGTAGGVYIASAGPNTFINNTITANAARTGPGGGVYVAPGGNVVITNSIVWNNPGATLSNLGLADGTSTATVTYSDIQGGFTGTGNINADPGFRRPADPNTLDAGDLALTDLAAPTDIGNNAVVPGTYVTDLNGRPRIQAQIVDMGAYESDPVPDTNAPTSSVNALPATATSNSFVVSWSGTDPVHGLGVRSYTIYVSVNNGPYAAFLTNTTATSTTYTGSGVNTYRFYSVATDNADNLEAKTLTPPAAEATITVPDLVPPTSTVRLQGSTATTAATNQLAIPITWSGVDTGGDNTIAGYTVYVSQDGGAYSAIPSLTNTQSTSGTYTGVAGSTYRFYARATDGAGNVEPDKSSPDVTILIDTTAPTSSIAALPGISPASFNLTINAADNAGGSGVASYAVYVSTNGGAYTLAASNLASNVYPFAGAEGNNYSFYSVVTDNAGNVESKSPVAEAFTNVDATAPTSNVAGLPAVSRSLDLPLSWSGSDNRTGVASYTVFVSINGGAYTAIPEFTNTTLTSGTYTGTAANTYRFYSRATDGAGNVEPAPATADATTFIDNDLLTERGDPNSNADLVVTALTTRLTRPVNGAIVGGSRVTTTARFRNIGTAVATNVVSVTFYLSDDNVVSGADRVLGTVTTRIAALRPRATGSATLTFNLPTDYAGSGRVLAWVNPGNAVTERTTLNDTGASNPFNIAVPVTNLTAVSLASASPRPGRNATARFLVRNTGNTVFNQVVQVGATFRLNGAANTGTVGGRSIRIRLNPGQSTTVSVPYILPVETAGRTGLLFSTIDPALQLASETNRSDNVSQATITVRSA